VRAPSVISGIVSAVSGLSFAGRARKSYVSSGSKISWTMLCE
jgi:hypothetical protein